MPHRAAYRTLVVAIGLVAPIGVPTTSASARCSLQVFDSTRPELFFMGTGTPDTTLAGGGDVREGGVLDRPGRRIADRTTRPIYGQVVRVGRVGGAGGARLERTLHDDRREVVLVPWGYGADCGVALWERSVRWATPDSVGLFTARLRPESLWVDRRPTLDVFAAWYGPYPHGEFLRSRRQAAHHRIAYWGIAPWPTADELFGLYEALPDRAALARDDSAAAARAGAWHRAHPGLAARAPAAGVLRELYWYADRRPDRQRLRALSSPVTGTYRLAVAFAGGGPRTLYVRLGRRALEGVGSSAALPDPARPGRHVVTVHGYELEALRAWSPEALPRSLDEPRPQPCDLTVVGLAIEPTRGPEGGAAWRGEIDTGFLTRCFRDDGAEGGLEDVERRLSAMWNERSAARGAEPYRREPPAVFRLHDDGRLTLEQVTEHQGRPLITVRGERISTETLAPRR